MPAQSLTGSQHLYVIVGESGAIEVDGYGKLQLSTPDGTELIWQQPAIDFVNRPLDPVRLEAFYTQTQAFVNDVLDGRAPTVSGAEGRAAVAIVAAAMRSTRTTMRSVRSRSSLVSTNPAISTFHRGAESTG